MLAAIPAAAPIPRAVDILVVGAGPAGLEAARAARAGRRAGACCSTSVPTRAASTTSRPRPSTAPAPDAQMRAGAALIAAVLAAGAVIESETLVWGAERDEDGRLAVSTLRRGEAGLVRPAMLIVATGAYERPAVLPGWTLPGVMTTGAAQTLLRSYGVAPGRRVLFAGNGPLNLQVARELQRAGVADPVLVEAAPAPWSRPRAALALALADPGLALRGLADLAALRASGAAIRFSHRLVAVEGTTSVEAAILAPLRPDGSLAGERIRMPVDAICTGDGFEPAGELARLLGLRFSTDAGGAERLMRGPDGATSQADVFVVGEAGGFGGAHLAGAMGELAGRTAARGLGLRPQGDDRGAATRIARHGRFQSRLWQLFAAPPAPVPDDEAMICRCEALSRAGLREAIAHHGIADLAMLKRLTRAGMGRCQGRYCVPELNRLLGAPSGEARLAPQAPLRPVPLAALAVEKPEWGGHRRALLPEQPLPDGRAPAGRGGGDAGDRGRDRGPVDGALPGAGRA